MILHLLCELGAGCVLMLFALLALFVVVLLLAVIGAPLVYLAIDDWPWNDGFMGMFTSAFFGLFTLGALGCIYALGAWYCQ